MDNRNPQDSGNSDEEERQFRNKILAAMTLPIYRPVFPLRGVIEHDEYLAYISYLIRPLQERSPEEVERWSRWCAVYGIDFESDKEYFNNFPVKVSFSSDTEDCSFIETDWAVLPEGTAAAPRRVRCRPIQVLHPFRHVPPESVRVSVPVRFFREPEPVAGGSNDNPQPGPSTSRQQQPTFIRPTQTHRDIYNRLLGSLQEMSRCLLDTETTQRNRMRDLLGRDPTARQSAPSTISVSSSDSDDSDDDDDPMVPARDIPTTTENSNTNIPPPPQPAPTETQDTSPRFPIHKTAHAINISDYFPTHQNPNHPHYVPPRHHNRSYISTAPSTSNIPRCSCEPNYIMYISKSGRFCKKLNPDSPHVPSCRFYQGPTPSTSNGQAPPSKVPKMTKKVRFAGTVQVFMEEPGVFSVSHTKLVDENNKPKLPPSPRSYPPRFYESSSDDDNDEVNKSNVPK